MVLVTTGNGTYVGLSGDRPLVGIVSGSRFTDAQTGEESFWNGSIWRQAPRSIFSGSQIGGVISGDSIFNGFITFSGGKNIPRQHEDFTVYQTGNALIAMRYDGVIQASGNRLTGSGFSDFMQRLFDSRSGTGGIFQIHQGGATYVSDPIIIPCAASANNVMQYHIRGYKASQRQANANTTLIVSGSVFPSGRFIFEVGTEADGSVRVSGKPSVIIEDLFAYNITPDSNNVGFFKVVCDSPLQTGYVSVQNVEAENFHKGILWDGPIYNSDIRDFTAEATDLTISGQYHIRMQNEGHYDVPKYPYLENLKLGITFTAGNSGGTYDNAMYLQTAYMRAFGIMIDGLAYNDACVKFHNASSNTIHKLFIMDQNKAGTASGTIIFDAAEFTDSANSGTPGASSLDNHLTHTLVHAFPGKPAVVFASGSAHNGIELASFAGSYTSVRGLGGTDNIVKAWGGQLVPHSGYAFTKLIVSGNANAARIIDERYGTENKGAITFNASGSNTAFFIPHALYDIPQTINVTAGSVAARSGGAYDVSGNLSGITVTFAQAPLSGTNNVKLHWYGSVY